MIAEESKSKLNPKSVSCEKCEEYGNRFLETEEQFQVMKAELGQLKEERKKIEEEYLSQIPIIKQCEFALVNY